MEIRIYYEDTDAAGVVYHSNYLGFMERARTEFFRNHNLSVAELDAAGTIFPVVRVELEFKAPARLDDLLQVITTPVKVGGSSFTLLQQVFRKSDQQLLVLAQVVLACVSSELKAKRVPKEIRNVLLKGLES